MPNGGKDQPNCGFVGRRSAEDSKVGPNGEQSIDDWLNMVYKVRWTDDLREEPSKHFCFKY